MTTISNPQASLNPAGQPSFLAFQHLFLILTLAAAGMAALLALLPAAGHDQLWFLMMSRRWLTGAQLYGPQAFDSNPPGVVWLSALPVLLGNTLHIPTTFAAKLLVILAETAATTLSYSFLKRARPSTRAYELPALLFSAIVLFYVVPARDLGQRDQILAFLILPYILAAIIPFRDHRLVLARITAAIMAAVGICLKPHYALIVITVELILLLKPSKLLTEPPKLDAGSSKLEAQSDPPSFKPSPKTSASETPSRIRQLLRPEPILIALIGIDFLAAIHHFTPLYFTSALPILHDTYWAIGHLSLPALALEAIELCILATISLALYLRTKPRSPAVLILLIAASAATLAYIIQGTGWYYQQLPAIDLFGAALTLQLLDLAQSKPSALAKIPRWLTPTVTALSVLALALTTHFTGYPFTPDRSFAITTPDPAFFTALPPNTSVAILTTSVDAAMMPIERYHLTWAQRTNNLWLLPAILRSETPTAGIPPRRILTPSAITALDNLQRRWMVEDLTHWHPQLILIDRCQDPTVQCQELEDRHDNLLAFFLRDPAFATLWQSYTYTGSHGDFDAYTLKP